MAQVTAAVLLVRHAVALARREWQGHDAARPLTVKGQQQAKGLIGLLADVPMDRVLASPARRCIDTVTPLAAVRGREVDKVDALAEGTATAALDVLFDDAGTVVACTHGDVIEAVLDALRADGWDLPSVPKNAKGSTWVLAQGHGRYLPPSTL